MSPALLIALGLELALGWPRGLYARIGHPVGWIGRAVTWAEARYNHGPPEARRRAGLWTMAAIVLGAAAVALWLAAALPGGPVGTLLTGLAAYPFVAARSLDDHVAAVARPLARDDLSAARHEVAKIVGRDPARLDAAGIARAATESLAENASDGVVAPVFWGLLLGLPGLVAYKAINTLDSMIGHRTPRHADFGRAAARLDDWANWLPARLTGLLFCAVSPRPRAAFATMRADAPGHRSPNAGWPEAAMAGALGIRLSGPRVYADGTAAEPWINAVAPDPTPADLGRALVLYRRAMIAMALTLALIWAAG